MYGHKSWLGEVVFGGAFFVLVPVVIVPAIAQHDDEKEKAAECFGNVRQLANAFQLYIADYDDRFPMAMTVNQETKTYRWNEWHSFLSSLAKNAQQGYEAYWANALIPYVPTRQVFACPSSEEKFVGNDNFPKGSAAISYTYNGLLNGFAAEDIVSPSELIVVWEGIGSARVVGFATAQPTLRCVSIREACRFVASKTPIGVMFRPLGTMKIHDGGLHMGFADSHAKRRRVGLQVTSGSAGPPFTDPLADPFTGYSAEGIPGYYFTDGFHPWLFRPSYKFTRSGSVWEEGVQVSAFAEGPSLPK